MTVSVSEVSQGVRVGKFEAQDFSASIEQPKQTYRLVSKRLIDIVLVSMAALFVVPLVAFLAVIIMIGGGSPFYTQTRVGRGGRHFRMFKLRTMVANGDELLELQLASSPESRHEWETTQKLKNDPRITSFGRFLRKSSLDELPQLLNVLLGDMSLVGPRPMMVSQVPLYPGQAYYRLRPGLTGFWQISDRNECDFADRATFDESYDRALSFGTDFQVILRTVGVVLRGTGY